MKSKEDLKQYAKGVAMAFGYNPDAISLDVINVKEAYCMGYTNGAREVAIDFLMWKGKKGYYILGGANNHTTNDDKIWIRQENQLIFSNPISTNELFELYNQETFR
jgi:hypothetical protein